MSNLIIAKTAGFCKGVRRAVEKVLTIAKKNDKETVTLGPVIHNPQVLDQLKNLGIRSIKDPAEASNKYVVIRAHGISPEIRETLKVQNACICDATCPDVGKVQGIIKKYAQKQYSTVIVGDAGHAEVQGLLGFTGDKGFVVSCVEDVVNLPQMEKVCVVAQTTQEKETFYTVCAALKKRFGEGNCEILDTICPSTIARQDEVKKIAGQVDLMIIIGGKNSANTARLAKISAETGAKTLHIEEDKELDAVDILAYPRIGVTAGASTPNWMIKQVIIKIKEKQCATLHPFLQKCIRTWDYIRHANLLVAFAAGCLSYAACYMQQFLSRKEYFFLSFFYILAVYTVNCMQNKSVLKLNKPSKLHFYNRNKYILIATVFFSIAAAMIITYFLGTIPFFALLFLLSLGFIYQFVVIPYRRNGTFVLKKLSQIPGSKDFIVILGWTTMVVLVPLLASGKFRLFVSGITILFIVTLVAIRSIVNDIQEIQEDMMVGAETLPIWLGTQKVMLIINSMVLITSVLLVISSMFKFIPSPGYLMVIPLWSMYFLSRHNQRLQYSLHFDFSDIIDFHFIAIGIMSYIQNIVR